MKNNLKKKVMLAMLAGGMLCMNGVLAAEDDIWWYGTPAGFVDVEPDPAVTTGVNLTITDDTQVNGKTVIDVYKNIYGGYTDGSLDVKNNVITFNTSETTTIAAFIFGGWTNGGNANGNSVTISDGTFSKMIYGGSSNDPSGTGNASGNMVTINNGTFNGIVYGGYSDGSGTAGGETRESGNKLTINDGIFNAQILGGKSRNGSAKNNLVKISNGTFSNAVFGGNGNSDTTHNEVIINDGTFSGFVYGGSGTNGASNNKVTIKKGSYSGQMVAAGYSTGGNAINNWLNIDGGTFSKNLFGGLGKSDVTDNRVVITDGIFSGTSMQIYGGRSSSGGNADNNIVEISGGAFGDGYSLYGGYTTGTSSDNTLNLKTAIAGTATEVKYFQNVNFTLPEGATSEVTMLKMEDTKTMSLANITFTTDLNGLALTGNDYITLVKGVNSDVGALAGHTNYYVLNIGGVKELVYSNGTPVAKGDYTIKQGSNKYDSGTTGNYTVQINGNTTDGSLSPTSYNGNEVIIRRGEYAPAVGNDAVAGAYNVTADAISNNTVKIYDGTFEGNIYGGYSSNGDACGNSVIINNGTFNGEIYGGYGDGTVGGDTPESGNKVIINNGTFNGEIYGGQSSNGIAANNSVTITEGTFNNNVYGGKGKTGAKNNILTINDGTFDNKILYGGYDTGNAENNIVNVKGGSFNGTAILAGASSSGIATGNILNIEGGSFNGAKIYGGYLGSPGTSSNNELNLKTKMNGKAGEVGYFQIMNFTLPSDIAGGDTMLSIATGGTAVALDGMAVNVYLNNYAGRGTITLIDNISGTGDYYKVYTGTEGSTHELTDDYVVVADNYVLYLKGTELWYTVGGTNKKFLYDDDTVKTINETADVVLYRGAGDDNEYTGITTGGKLTVGGDETTTQGFLVTGDVSADEGVEILANKTLTVGASNLKSAVDNKGTVVLNADGTLATGSTITGGVLNINADIRANAGDIAGNTNTVASGKNLTLIGGVLAKPVGGAGNVVIDGEVSSSANNLQGTISVNQDGNMYLTDGVLSHAVTGDGWVNVSTTGDNEVTIAADVNKLKNSGRMKVSGSQPVTFTNANFAAGSILTLNASDCITQAPILIAAGGSITIDETAVLRVEGAEKNIAYSIVGGVEDNFDESAWSLSNIDGCGLKVKNVDVVGNVYQITFKSCVPENTMLKNLLADGKNNKLMDWAEGITDMYGGDEVLATNEINAMAAMGENLGVTRGALDVTRMVGVSVADHLFAKNLTVKARGGLRNVGSYDKDNSELNVAEIPVAPADEVMPKRVEEVKYGSGNTWARFTHNRVKVDGMHTGDMKSQYSAQYNGVSVGYDLVDDQDITLGVALHYADGNASNGFGGHNDSTYTGGSVYAQKLMGKVVVSGEVTYLHGKNEMDQAGVTAKARTNTVSMGFDVRQPIKVGKGYVTPFTGMRYNHVQNKGYTDSLNTNRSSNNVSNFVTPVGVRYSVTIDKFYGWTVQPFAEIGYLFNYGDKGSDMKLRYGTAEDTFGFDIVDKNTFFTRAGMNFGKKNLTIGLGYDYMKSSNSNNNKWNVNLTYSF